MAVENEISDDKESFSEVLLIVIEEESEQISSLIKIARGESDSRREMNGASVSGFFHLLQ